ncbi:MAG: GntR family transcriptional regulator [Candidatus Promineifilaceae bacterium]|nr:GntR family transcriptional regulator [Candidatus Promineifilaceae bacterium]
MLSKTPPVPKYFQLAQILSEQISSGALQPGDQLPTEEELGASYDLSRGTVREAIRLLENDGLVRRERGRGTFVAAVTRSSSLFSLMPFDEAMRRQNRSPSTRLLTAELLPATAELAQRLALEEGETVIHTVRLRLADEQPVVYEERYLAQELCPQLLAEDLVNSSIHQLIVFKYDVPLVKMTYTVEVGVLPAAEAKILQASPGDEAFFVERLTYSERDGARFPAVWFKGIYRESDFNLMARLQDSL